MKKILQLSVLLLATISFGQTPVQRFNFENNLQNTANNLTLTAANITYEAGRNAGAGQAMVINNNVSTTNSYVDSTIIGLSTTGGAFSYSFWAKFNNNTQFDKENSLLCIGTKTTITGINGGVRFFQKVNANTETFSASYGSASFATDFWTSTTGTGASAGWNFYTFTYNGSGTTKLYKNGVQLGGNTTTNITLANLILKMGRWNDSVYDNFPRGAFSMDDLQLFNIALTDAQISSIYSPATVPTVTLIPASTTTTSNSGTINFTINANGGNTTTVIEYGLIGINFPNSVSGPTATGTSNTSLSKTITGLLPNTFYQYRITATNSAGSVTSGISSFQTALAQSSTIPIYHFPFNGTLQSSDLASVFVPIVGATDLTNSQININNSIFAASLPNLPIGNGARTVSIRVWFPQFAMNSANNIFNYGTDAANQAYGYTQDSSSQATHYFWGATDISLFSNPMNFGTWYNMAFVYDGTTATVYRDGTLVTSATKNLNTTGTEFNLAIGSVKASVDDLRIYNAALTAAEITALNATLSNQDFNTNNLKFSMYPNPANDILNIEMEKEIQSVEIYSLQGQKILADTNKKISIGNLSNGIYMVRVQEVDGSVATQKLVKK